MYTLILPYVEEINLSGRLGEAKEICDKIATQNNTDKIAGEIFCSAAKNSSKPFNADMFKQPFLR